MLTVLFATRNGEHTLPTVLEAYRHLLAPDGGWKLVVVDNDSTDATPQILATFDSALPLTRRQWPTSGKNRALNAGLADCEGDLVVLTDDDAIPDPTWLRELRAAANAHPEFDIFGGAIVPAWEREPEDWLLHWVPQGVTYTLTDDKTPDGPVDANRVWGPNMAVRARIFEAGQRFEEGIGPTRDASYVMGSETEFTLRLQARGHRAWFVPGARVAHMIRAFQMERSWVLRRATRFGRGMSWRARQPGAAPASAPMLLGVPRWLIRQLVAGAMSWTLSRLRGDRESAFRSAWSLFYHFGYLVEARSPSQRT